MTTPSKQLLFLSFIHVKVALDGDAVGDEIEEITHRAFPNIRLGAATSLGGIAQYGTERTGRIESAPDGD